MKRVAITQSNYIPWKGYFHIMHGVDEFILYDDVQYTKRDWRNRNLIKTPSGLQWLTIPVKVKGRFHQKINETEVADKYWAEKHWEAIRLNYSKASYFRSFQAVIEKMYLDASKLELLSDINYLFLESLCSLVGITNRIRRSTEFKVFGDPSEKLLAICQQLGAHEYVTGPAASNYLNASLFLKSEVNVIFMDYQNYPVYQQLHGKFIHGVSFVDTIFNMGVNARGSFLTCESRDDDL